MKRRLQGSAAIACEPCRRQKMRCVGAENPPCQRCAKVNRRCNVTHYRRNRAVDHRQVTAVSQETIPPSNTENQETIHVSDLSQPTVELPPTGTPSLAASERPQLGSLDRHQHVEVLNHNDLTSQEIESCKRPFSLPSVYLTSPLSTLATQLGTISAAAQPTTTASDVSSKTFPYPATHQPLTPLNAGLSQQKLFALLQFFRANILINVMFMFREELDDLDDLIKHKPDLAICIAYVSSLFVPGRGTLRKSLSLHVLQIVRRDHDVARLSNQDTWTMLQALSLLYLFALPTDGTASGEESLYHPELSHRALKPLVESVALHASIHRSYEDVMRESFDETTNINEAPLKRYLLWLWLFTASQQYALITRTPPTISEDTTIRSAPIVLHNLRGNIFVRRILSQVDLYLLWGRVGLRYPNLREWWSSPYADLDLGSTKAMLQAFNEELEEWRQRWFMAEFQGQLETTPGLHENASIEFAFRYTKFHISTYVTRSLYTAVSESLQSHGRSSRLVALTPPLLELFAQSIEAATKFSRFYIDLDPLLSETSRYVSAISFAKVAFACLYVIMASEVLAGPDLNLNGHLDTVREVAVGMSEIAVDQSAPPKVYADKILQRMQALSTSRGLNALHIVSNQAEAPSKTADVSRPIRNDTNFSHSTTSSIIHPLATYAVDQDTEPGESNMFGIGLDFADLNFMLSNEAENFFHVDNDWAL